MSTITIAIPNIRPYLPQVLAKSSTLTLACSGVCVALALDALYHFVTVKDRSEYWNRNLAFNNCLPRVIFYSVAAMSPLPYVATIAAVIPLIETFLNLPDTDAQLAKNQYDSSHVGY